MKQRKRKTKEQREKIVQAYFNGNRSMVKVAKANGISQATLANWVREARKRKINAIDTKINPPIQMLKFIEYNGISYEAGTLVNQLDDLKAENIRLKDKIVEMVMR